MLDGTGEKASVGGAGTAATSRMAAEQQILMVADQASKALCAFSQHVTLRSASFRIIESIICKKPGAIESLSAFSA